MAPLMKMTQVTTATDTVVIICPYCFGFALVIPANPGQVGRAVKAHGLGAGGWPFGLGSASVADGQLPDGPGVGCGTMTGVPVRWPVEAGDTPHETAININAAITVTIRATPMVTGAANRRWCCGLGGRLTGTSMVAAMIAPSRLTRTPLDGTES